MSCLLWDQPFGQNTITLNCGHKFDKKCLRKDFQEKLEIPEPCICPICFKDYYAALLINVDIFTTEIRKERISKIQALVRKRAYELDKEHQRVHTPNEYKINPTKESMDEARLIYKQLLKQQALQQKQEQEALIREQQRENEVLKRQQIESEELIQEQQELIREQQIQNQVLKRQQIEREELIRDQKERIQKLSRQEQYYNTFEKLKGKNRKPVYFE
jgi:hypothetical protein